MSKKSNAGNTIDFAALIYKAKHELHLSDEDLLKFPSIKAILRRKRNSVGKSILTISALFLLFVALPSGIVWSVVTKTDTGYMLVKIMHQLLEIKDTVNKSECLVPNVEIFANQFRGPINCSECSNIKGVKRLKNLSPEEFADNYAFSMQPILVEDAQVNWTATKEFNYYFFKEVYKNKEILDQVDEECQFFGYQTKMEGLVDLFNMSASRVEGKEEPWYIGWSNCIGETANRLREHYKTPYFLPRYMDRSNVDWIFMGLPGWGATMHIDNVNALSWQAQIKGTKKWTLQAPPECYGQCIDEMEIIVKPGDIIVLDTNRWFHQTKIIGDETSIVIGSEYY